MINPGCTLDKAKKSFILLILVAVIIYHLYFTQPFITLNSVITKNVWIRPELGSIKPGASRKFARKLRHTIPIGNDCQKEYEGFTIHNRSYEPFETDDATCTRKQILPANTCEAMKVRISTLVDKCDSFKEIQLCIVKETTRADYTFNCSLARVACTTLFFGFYNLSRGFALQWHLLQNSTYEQELHSYSKKVETGILQCHLKSYWSALFKTHRVIHKSMTFVEQIVWFLKKPTPLRSLRKVFSGPSISIIFLDSFSRSILYQSLPKTIDFMRKLNSKGTRKVLDFKLFQSIADSTYWHLYNLFDGPNADMNDGGDSYFHRKSATFFRRFRERGYMTALSHDLCYRFTWRGPHFADSVTKFKIFKKVLDDLNLDNFGLSLVLCEFVLTYIRSYDMFGEYGKCFNGRRFMEYQLDYMAQLQQSWLSEGRKFVSFLESNFKHGGTIGSGKFNDINLKRHLQLITRNPDTMVVFVSDHGHKHGSWMEEQSPGSQTDIYHPFLFILLPERERRFFSEAELQNLRTNQNRLLTMRDLHFLFAKFWGDNRATADSLSGEEYRGILSEIPYDRTCSHITYTKGGAINNCICERNSKNVTDEETEDLILFLNLELNRLLELSYKSSDTAENTCETIDLEPTAGNGLEKYDSTDNQVAITGLLQQRQFTYKESKVVFFVTVEKNFNRGNSFYKLQSFQRTDEYSRFEGCFPKGFSDPRLCLCY